MIMKKHYVYNQGKKFFSCLWFSTSPKLRAILGTDSGNQISLFQSTLMARLQRHGQTDIVVYNPFADGNHRIVSGCRLLGE
ncbi:unnamed protein product [Ilex paraguariensis]|uniref:Uncharacterized protein n=1 Tax=Ilex paraguariensis TaxID=185542 RepID=A0ABC8U9A1_9AQUA